MNYRTAMFPGSFDPVQNGHIEVISRLAKLYDKVYVVVADNRSKNNLFSAEERCKFLNNALNKIENVEVCIWEGLIVDFAQKHDVGVVIRGVRNQLDFNYEFDVSALNKSLCPELEFLFIPANTDAMLLRSSSVKELSSFKADVTAMVPEDVAKALAEKYKG